YCHIPSSRPSKYVAREGDAKVCNECHLDKVKEFKRNKYVHGPVAVGMCSVCHNPHASDYKAQLHDKTNAVCLSCHE
ncbi:cytochrome C, partial [candidate division KSB1 bacterium]|nr:cytochrome C [Candidatus Saccharibacteria bacterium]NIR48272.1 cytochrome C [candidate division KSB1 bacterium]NIV69701.1 cytochrome C [Phycisphaerae bacterium]NIS23786.1 cytochrome C [candidate division KSB1 bacterium]NIT70705.1 cytochrome C [candidate division KSB1 bacterium]